MKLYRIIDFFELVDLLSRERLRVPSSRGFSDPNELVGDIFYRLLDPMFTPHTVDGVERVISDHTVLRESRFVSCWTKTRDSIAMWEIYSPNKTSVQIEADHDRLKAAFAKFSEDNCYTSAIGREENWANTVFYPPELCDCNYMNLLDTYNELREFCRSTSDRMTDAIRRGSDQEFKIRLHDADEFAASKLQALRYAKDEVFKHEDEYRFSLRAMRRNDRPFAECEQDSGHVLFDTHLRPATQAEIGDNIFVDFPKKSINAVYLDGRLPEWKHDIQAQILNGLGVVATRSPAYGAFLQDMPVEKWWD